MKIKKIFALSALFLSIPLFTFAQTIMDTLDMFEEVGNMFFGIFGAAAFVVFAWGIAKVIFNSDDEKKRQEAKYVLIWSSIAMFVLVTIWGIIGFLQTTVGNDTGPGQLNIEVPNMP
jgi:amino acid permease